MQIKSLIKKINKTLKKVSAVPGVAYKRKVVLPSYDSLLGTTSGAPAITDTILDPQPAVSTLSRDSPLVLGSNGKFLATDYFVIVSISALTELELKTENVSIVIKDNGIDTDFDIVYYNAVGLNNTKIIWNLVIRAKGQT